MTKGIVQGLYVGIRAEPNEYAEAFMEERLEEFGTPVEAGKGLISIVMPEAFPRSGIESTDRERFALLEMAVARNIAERNLIGKLLPFPDENQLFFDRRLVNTQILDHMPIRRARQAVDDAVAEYFKVERLKRTRGYWLGLVWRPADAPHLDNAILPRLPINAAFRVSGFKIEAQDTLGRTSR